MPSTTGFTEKYLLGEHVWFDIGGGMIGNGKLGVDDDGYYARFGKIKLHLLEGEEVVYISENLVIRLKLRRPKVK